nr:cytochrome c-type biogenesis protein CcmE homolog, mitochondrial-like [Tanacetum cinerariifolium]
VLSVVGLLQNEVDPMVSVMKVEKVHLESYADIENLLSTADHKIVKLADFSLEREESLTEMMTAETGTYRCMASEHYNAKTREKKHYNHDGYSVVVEGFVKPITDEIRGVVEEKSVGVSGKARSVECYFDASEVLAKHDEKYMPAEVANAIEKNKKLLAEEAEAGKEKGGEEEGKELNGCINVICLEVERIYIMEKLLSCSILYLYRETWRCSLDGNGEFTVKSLSEWVEDMSLSGDSGSSQTLWSKIIPRKVNIFIWRVLKRRIPVRVELDKRDRFRLCALPMLRQ